MELSSGQEAVLIFEEKKMSFLKLNGGNNVMLVAFIMLMASSQAAMADTKTLICTGWSPAEAIGT